MRTLLIAGAVGLVLSWQQNAHATCVPECIDDGWSNIPYDTAPGPSAGYREFAAQQDRWVDNMPVTPSPGKQWQQYYDERVDAINEFNSRR